MSSPYFRNPGLFKQMAEWVIETIKARAPEKKVADKLVDIASKKRSIGMIGEMGFPEQVIVEGKPYAGVYHPFQPNILPQLRDPKTKARRNLEDFTFPEILDALADSRSGIREGIQISARTRPDLMADVLRHELAHLGQDINPKGVLRYRRNLLHPFYFIDVPHDQRLEEFLAVNRVLKEYGIKSSPIKDLVSWYTRSKANPLVRLQIENLAEINPDLKRALAPYRSGKTERNVRWYLGEY